ncbi:MAG: F0F1 ATP synthase subunit A [Bacteroidales bacterium]|nr:F0F1 ATP synthase subunit A [Bacteroidales bacterium]MDD2424939.1 F0F1 ATP synthase subunit A [Bacteroidales bacterium]MDD3989091.1 F0F1 ATP synthase subunit A [Bacteroidales bacterium]MDD4638474.1 F0F1 ATP synthase subunit A [Bacteroidales bacterium]
MSSFKTTLSLLTAALFFSCNLYAEKPDVKGMINEHIRDSYSWHITRFNDKDISLPLPVIVIGKECGAALFLSSRLEEGDSYKNLRIAGTGKYKGKIVEILSNGEESRPFDISITKNVLAIIINSIILIYLVLYTARRYRKNPLVVPGGFAGFMEMFIMDITDSMIKPCVGKDYLRYTPYLLTAFFFIFINNLMGLLPLFPGGANTTGNIAITMVLSLFTFFTVNIFGTREYYREIFWPEVPKWMKLPIPLMPFIEMIGMFTKPFSLMIRLFANITAGHSVVLGLISIIFITAQMGPIVNGGMTVMSIILTVFMTVIEILVAYIQAYVFTMLSAVFIGLSRAEESHAKQKKTI